MTDAAARPRPGGSSGRQVDQGHPFFAAQPTERYLALATLSPAMFAHDGDQRFSFGLAVLLTGLEAVGRPV